jgi:hypothetical protein
MVPHGDKAPPEDRRSGDRRRVSRYRFLNRRTAFDRRRRYPVLGSLRDSPWMLLAVLIAANLLSLADGVLTAIEIQAGIATEGNPILAPLYASSPYFAIAFKIIVVALVSAGIWHQRRYRHVLAVSLLALAVFTGLLAYHLGNLQGLGYL